MEINNIINKALLRYPLFGITIANLKVQHSNDSVPAPAFTDGGTIYYKDEFITDYNDAEKEFIIAHEIFHIVLSHMLRNIGKDKDLLNYVEDAIINQLLVRDGLTMPDGLVNVKDALEYSVDELYMKLLPQINQIKQWMGANTYHMELSQLNEQLNETLDQIYDDDLESLMSDNQTIRDEMLRDYAEKLKQDAEAGQKKAGGIGLGLECNCASVGKSIPLLHWRELLKNSLVLPDELATAFYEVQMDGIIKKEGKPDESDSESEIIIDSSGSMNMEKIKAILRECKNILSVSHIKVGFCDIIFYGWNEIRTYEDIDTLKITGRGGTSFENMAKSFSTNVDNKIVITDGCCTFPKDRPDILWVIINNYELYSYIELELTKKSVNYIFINEKDIPVPEIQKKLVLSK